MPITSTGIYLSFSHQKAKATPRFRLQALHPGCLIRFNRFENADDPTFPLQVRCLHRRGITPRNMVSVFILRREGYVTVWLTCRHQEIWSKPPVYGIRSRWSTNTLMVDCSDHVSLVTRIA